MFVVIILQTSNALSTILGSLTNYLTSMPTSYNSTNIQSQLKHKSLEKHKGYEYLNFDNPLQANIIFFVNNGKLFTASEAACNLLGYSKKEFLVKNSTDIFDISKREFSKLLKQANSKIHTSSLITLIKKNGKTISCEVTSAIFKDDQGIEKCIIALSDMSAGILKQQQIDIQKEKIVAENIAIAKSKQKSIDIKKAKKVEDNIALVKLKQINIDIKNAKRVADDIVIAISKQLKIDAKKDKIVRDNIAFAKAKQINIDIKNAKKVADDIVIAISKQIKIDAIKEKIVRENILLAISKQKKIDEQNAKTVAHNIILAIAEHNALQGKLNDEITSKVKQLIDNDNRFNLIFNSSSDVLYDNNLETGNVIISDAYEKEYGYKTNSNMTPLGDWVEHIHPEDKEEVYLDYLKMIASDDVEWENNYRFLRANGEVANVLSKAIVLRNTDGKAYRLIGYMRDNSKQKVLEERLEHDIKLKEKQIEEAMKEAKETERSEIGKELHDNVNQLLGASKLYLEMAKGGGKESEMYLKRSTEYTLNAIEEIRKLTKGLTTDFIKNLGLTEALKNITHDTMEVSPLKINLRMERFNEDNVDDKFKLNLFRIVQEQLNNILKHSQATEVNITLSRNMRSIILTISDNGLGFDTTKKCNGIGLSNIKGRVASYQGTAEVVSQTGSGCVLITTFPVMDSPASLN